MSVPFTGVCFGNTAVDKEANYCKLTQTHLRRARDYKKEALLCCYGGRLGAACLKAAITGQWVAINFNQGHFTLD